jgi:hypothetical protein
MLKFPILLVLLSLLSYVRSIQHRRMSKSRRTLRAANRALEHLSFCCESTTCRERQFSDLLSGLWNFAALSQETAPKVYHRAIEIAEDCRIAQHLETKLMSIRKSCNHLTVDSCNIQRIVLEFQAMRWNILPTNTLLTMSINNKEQLNVTLFKILGRSGWSPQDVYSTRQDENQHWMSIPSAAEVDQALVLGWAARRAGHSIDGWSDMNMLMNHVNMFRPLYADHLPGYLPKHVQDIVHVGHVQNDGTISTEAKRDLVWMAMHVVYVVAEFGLWSASQGDVAPEVEFLNGMILHAIAEEDLDMLGELVDCLNLIEVDASTDRTVLLSNVPVGRAHLIQEQFSDGSFSTSDASDHWHTTHVAGLALLPRPSRRPKGTLRDDVTQKSFWDIAEMVMPKSEVHSQQEL